MILDQRQPSMQELSGVSETARELPMSRFRLIQTHLEQNRPLQLVAADGKLPVVFPLPVESFC